MELQVVLNGTNAIWNNTGIEFYIMNNEIKRIEVPDNYVLVGRSGNSTIDGSRLGEKVAGEKFHDDVLDVIFMKTFAAKSNLIGEGIGLNYDDVGAAFVSQRGYMSWVLAHELAHILNNNDEN